MLIVSDMAMSCAEKTEGDRSGVERLFQCRVTVRPKGVGLWDKNLWLRTADEVTFTLQSSLRWARVAAQV